MLTGVVKAPCLIWLGEFSDFHHRSQEKVSDILSVNHVCGEEFIPLVSCTILFVSLSHYRHAASNLIQASAVFTSILGVHYGVLLPSINGRMFPATSPRSSTLLISVQQNIGSVTSELWPSMKSTIRTSWKILRHPEPTEKSRLQTRSTQSSADLSQSKITVRVIHCSTVVCG